ncbi:MAG: hypothetical protein WDZ91_15415 [Paenibacillaceae bacterium]
MYYNDKWLLREDESKLDNGISVKLLEKMPDGTLRHIEERIWQMNMIASLAHVNYIIVGEQEYETVEGRLNVDEGKLELLLVPLRNE